MSKQNERMMLFTNEEFGSVRTLKIEGEPWFVGKDVAEALGYSNASKAIINHVGEEDKKQKMLDFRADSQNGNASVGQTKIVLINEHSVRHVKK